MFSWFGPLGILPAFTAFIYSSIVITSLVKGQSTLSWLWGCVMTGLGYFSLKVFFAVFVLSVSAIVSNWSICEVVGSLGGARSRVCCVWFWLCKTSSIWSKSSCGLSLPSGTHRVAGVLCRIATTVCCALCDQNICAYFKTNLTAESVRYTIQMPIHMTPWWSIGMTFGMPAFNLQQCSSFDRYDQCMSKNSHRV